MSIEAQILDKKAEIKILVNQYTNTPIADSDSELFMGVIAVHKEELSLLKELFNQYQQAKLSTTKRITII